MVDQQEFLSTFKAFMDVAVAEHHERAERVPALTEAVSAFLGVDAQDLAVVTEEVPTSRLPDADIALEVLAAEGEDSQLVGMAGGHSRLHTSFSGLLSGESGPVRLGAVAYQNVAVSPTTERQIIAFGIRMLRYDGQPVAVLQRVANAEYGNPRPTLEVVSASPELTARLLADVRRLMAERSVLRGQVVSFTRSDYERNSGGITFHERPSVGADDIVLPEGAVERLVRHAISLGEQRERLLAAGQHLKRGILLYGPPGTGKTLTIRHLLTRTPDVTAILLAGKTLGLISEAAQIARVVQPAIVVLEDCDLIAEDRDLHDGGGSMLFELLEALDGLEGDADVTFVLTTNRADLLERALAQRPGRVDLAVEIPLPDEDARRALFALYARGLGLGTDALSAAAARAEGVTASFAKELVRRAVLLAALEEREVADADLDSALDELLSDRESLTRSLLASGPRRFAGDGPLGIAAADWDDED